MVGYLTLMRLLHCKRNRLRGRRKDTINCIQSDKYISSENPLKEKENEDKTHICRVCLKDGHIPIFGNSDAEDISNNFRTFADIEINRDDDFPKHLCQSCHSLLQSAILFRKYAQSSDETLRQPPSVHSESEDGINDENYEELGSRDVIKQPSYYHCKRCDLSFNTFAQYDEHRLSQEHENIRKVCPICNKSYKALYLTRHLGSHKLESSYMCDICGKKFVIKGQFTRHRVTHFNNLPFKCSLCPYRGRFTESLKMHMRSHTGEKPYQCPQCPSRSFVNKSNLNKHMLTHKGDHDFKCDSCGRGFYTKRDLDLHFKVDHTGIKEHVCNLCGKAFGYRKQMMKHQLNVHKRQKLGNGRVPLYLQIESKDQDDHS